MQSNSVINKTKHTKSNMDDQLRDPNLQIEYQSVKKKKLEKAFNSIVAVAAQSGKHQTVTA